MDYDAYLECYFLFFYSGRRVSVHSAPSYRQTLGKRHPEVVNLAAVFPFHKETLQNSPDDDYKNIELLND